MGKMGFLALDHVGNVFGDTSFFVAALNPADADHSLALDLSHDVAARRIRVITTWEVVVECVALLRYRVGFRESQEFLTQVASALTILHPDENERKAAIDFYLKRSATRRLSLCDAISYVVVSTRLDWAPCLTFDSDFAALGLTVVR